MERSTVCLCIAWILTLTTDISLHQEFLSLDYKIQEEGGVGVFVGNAGKDSGLYKPDGQRLNFQTFTNDEYVSYFSVNSTNGVIRTAKNFDREAVCPNTNVCVVKLNIPAYVNGTSNMDKLIEVKISIDDINDNNPTFPNPAITLSVPENSDVNYPLETSVASDADAVGENSRVTYRLEPPSDIFELSTVKTLDGVEDLVITVKKVLDREQNSSYALLVVATDWGKPPRSGTVRINVSVTDVNDNSPVFLQPNYTVSILENSDTVKPVVRVSATDRDEGLNAKLTYSLSSQAAPEIQNTFVVNRDTGEIYAKTKLDYEQKIIYQFQVVVADQGSPAKSNFVLVTVNVVDVNDNAPDIHVHPAPGGDTVLENGSVGKFLGHIKVSDADSGLSGQVSCMIEDSNFLLEALDQSSMGFYKIMLNHALDREEASVRKVVITCQDNDPKPLTATASFNVSVEDVNDNAPQFDPKSLLGSVPENRNEMTVMQVVATDPDMGENSRVTYAITNGIDTSPFSINQNSGIITTTRPLDREFKSEYQLVVTASDHGAVPLVSSASVTIQVLDENDNPPKFRKQPFILSIAENLPLGSPAGEVIAFDPDIGDNARVNFSILDQGPGAEDGFMFTIDPLTGLLRSTTTFDREDKKVYSFQVKVQDPTLPNFYDVGNVTVLIEDDNDHNPVIIKPPPNNRTFRCPFNMTVGSIITVISATDEDDPKLVEISYQLQTKDSKKPFLFSVDPSSGKLLLARQIRPEDVNTYTVTVNARDGPGSIARSASVMLSIIVEEGSEEAMRAFSEGSKTNMVIVIIIVAATLVLAFIVVVVICLIRRMDKKRHAQPPSSNSENKLYQAAQWVSTVSMTNEPGVNEMRSALEVTGEKKKKKEVSFSLEDDVAASPDTSGSVPTVFPPVGPNPGRRVDSLPFQANTRPGEFIVLNGMTTPDYSQHLYDINSSSTDHQDERQFMEVRHTEDRYSDASSGDTGTSDSGRGGSEDESHGHTSSSQDGDTRKFKLGSSLNPSAPASILKPSCLLKQDTNSLRRQKMQQKQQQQRDPSPRDPEDIPGSPTPLLSGVERQSSPHCYIRRSFETLPALGLGYPAGASTISSPSSSNNQTSLYHSQPRHSSARVALSNKDLSRGRISDQLQDPQPLQTFSSPYAMGVPHSNSHPAWKRSQALDTSWRSTTSGYHDDDDNTTTSGSYTISPDELLKEDTYNPDVMV